MDIIDRNDRVIGSADRTIIYKDKLRHRIVHVLLFTDDGKMMLQKRSKNVSYCPGHWCTAVGGHVRSGETYEVAAMRESLEELGIKPEIKLFKKIFYRGEDQELEKFLGIFIAKVPSEITIDKDELEMVESFTLGDIVNMAKTEKFHPELSFIIDEYDKELYTI